jgi:hypothetical protein
MFGNNACPAANNPTAVAVLCVGMIWHVNVVLFREYAPTSQRKNFTELGLIVRISPDVFVEVSSVDHVEPSIDPSSATDTLVAVPPLIIVCQVKLPTDGM